MSFCKFASLACFNYYFSLTLFACGAPGKVIYDLISEPWTTVLVARGLAIRSEKCFKDAFCLKLLFCSSPNEILLLHTFILEWEEQQWRRGGVCL